MARIMIIRRIAPLSLAKVAGVVYGALGLIFGALFSLISLIASAFPTAQAKPAFPLFGLFFGLGAIIFFPIFYAITGFLLALVFASIYNLVASRIGGIEIDIS
jgi:hypothetical protein